MGSDGLGRRMVERLLEAAGIRVGGDRAWDLQVRDPRFYWRVIRSSSLGLGESYMDGWWDCQRIDEMIARVLTAQLDRRLLDWRRYLVLLQARLVNLQTLVRAPQVAEVHYNLGNSFFEKMLGPTMNYSCGYWRDAEDLDAAQTAKMDLICRKLGLDSGQKLLDIGCGWGELACYAAKRFGCQVVGITISRPQCEYATEHARGLSVRILPLDYRSAELDALGPFDRIVSVGMFEHVGHKNYREFLDIVRRLLVPGGLFLLHTIGNDDVPTDPWLNGYIFPNGMLPAVDDIASATRRRFVIEDWHNFGSDYDRTLMAWHTNFERHAAEPGASLETRFYRMWRYYLLSMAGSFRSRTNQLWQIVLSPRGVAGGYRSIR